ncbi:MAG TPA: hypothetical protein VMV57_14745 [Terracidiphilus sp.]|nr:hypothetical protein [Terracidiphilus sp.]
MKPPGIVSQTKKLGNQLIKWGLRFFILGIGITLIILFLGLFGVSFGIGLQLAIQLGIAISMSFGFVPLLSGCTLLICASLHETIVGTKDSRKGIK